MMEANPDKAELIVLNKNNTKRDVCLNIDDKILNLEPHVLLLGIYMYQKMNFKDHVKDLCTKDARQLAALSRLRHILHAESKDIFAQISTSAPWCDTLVANP